MTTTARYASFTRSRTRITLLAETNDLTLATTDLDHIDPLFTEAAHRMQARSNGCTMGLTEVTPAPLERPGVWTTPGKGADMPETTCSVSYCDERVLCKQLCARHYDQQRLGKPLTPRPTKFKTCTVDGCDNKHTAKGLCSTHRHRLERTGSLELAFRPARIELFHAKVQESEGHWLWTGSRDGDGYARIGIDGASILAHRWIWEHTNGPIPKGLEIDHLCEIRNCVNPAHMETVTHGENVRRIHHRPNQPRTQETER